MKIELKSWLIKCDRCGVTREVRDHIGNGTPSLPDGWESVKVTGVGMHGYGTRHDELCPQCIEERKKEQL